MGNDALEITISPFGEVEKRLNGVYHCEDGPAVVWADGATFWYRYGKVHRIGGPAFEAANGDKEWCQNGETHRIDGPAVEWANGDKDWYLYNVKYDPMEWLLKLHELGLK